MNLPNSYSIGAWNLLPKIPSSQGAEKFLEVLKTVTKARRLELAEGFETFVADTEIKKGTIIVQVTGHVAVETEVIRNPGGNHGIIIYDGFIGMTSSICLNTTAYIRRSCEPNTILKHVMCNQTALNFFLVASKEIPFDDELTVPFDLDWIESRYPLECAKHHDRMYECPFELKRLEPVQWKNLKNFELQEVKLEEPMEQNVSQTSEMMQRNEMISNYCNNFVIPEPARLSGGYSNDPIIEHPMPVIQENISYFKQPEYLPGRFDPVLEWFGEQETMNQLKTSRYTHPSKNIPLSQEDVIFFEFFARKASTSPMCSEQICEEFLDYFETSQQSFELLRNRFVKYLAPTIPYLSIYDSETKARMMFVSGTPIDKEFLEELRENAEVEISSRNRIIKYKGRNGGLVLEGGDELQKMKESLFECRNKKKAEGYMNKRESNTVSSHIKSIISRISESIKIQEAIQNKPEVHEQSEEIRLAEESIDRIIKEREMYERISCHDMDYRTNLPIYSATSNREMVENETLVEEDAAENPEDVREDSEVMKENFEDVKEEIDDIEEEPKESIQKVKRGGRRKPKPIEYDDTDRELLDFLAKKSRIVDYPMILQDLWREFQEKHGTMLLHMQLQTRFRSKLSPQIHKLDEYDIETRVRMLFMTSTPVDTDFLEILRTCAEVKVDKSKRITFYEAAGGGLRLDSDHSISTKRRNSKAGKRVSTDASDVPIPSINEKKKKSTPKRQKEIEEPKAVTFDRPEIASESIELIEVKQEEPPMIQNNSYSNTYDYDQSYNQQFMSNNNPNPENEEREAEVKMETDEFVRNQSSTLEIPKTKSFKKFLRLFKNFINALEISQLTDIRERINNIIDKLGNSDEKVPIDSIQLVFEMIYQVVTRKFHLSSFRLSPFEPSLESTTSLEEFLNLLKITMLGMESDELLGILERVDKSIHNLRFKDEMIPIDKIRAAFEMIHSIISH